MTSPLEQLQMIAPPPPVTINVSWEDTEATLGTPLPEDYKRLVNLYGPGSFDGFLCVLQPMPNNDNLDLVIQSRARLDALSTLRDMGEVLPYDIESGELIPWAITDNGDVCYWTTREGIHPDDWTIAVNESRAQIWRVFEGTSTKFLTGILRRTLRIDIFPDDFPSTRPRFSPIDF